MYRVEVVIRYPSRDELLDQMYSMRSRFTDYASYADASLSPSLGQRPRCARQRWKRYLPKKAFSVRIRTYGIHLVGLPEHRLDALSLGVRIRA